MAKEKGSEVYNIIAFVFADRGTARQVYDEIKIGAPAGSYKVLADAAVEVDEKGKAHIHEGGHGGWGAAIGAGGFGLLSLIGGPAGLLAWAVAGGVIGGFAGKVGGRAIPKKDLEALAAKMQPNTSAVLALVEDKGAEALIDSMQGYKAQVVTLTVGDEVAGEIAQAVAIQAQAPAQSPAAADTSATKGKETK